MPRIKHSATPSLSPNDIARFWSRVKVRHKSQCWEWNGAKFRAGYGCFWAQGRDWYCHRIAFFLFTGEDVGQSLACHRCDNPPCCNPYHIFKGTPLANTHDMISKNRNWVPTGDLHYGRKVSSKDVLRIASLRGIKPFRRIAQEFSVSIGCIQGIMDGKTWSRVTGLTYKPHQKLRS